MDNEKNDHLNEMKDRPNMIETIHFRVLQDLQEGGWIDESKLMEFKKLGFMVSGKRNEHVIKYFNDLDSRMNGHGLSSYYKRGLVVDLIKNKGSKLADILGAVTWVDLEKYVLDSFNKLMSQLGTPVNEKTDEIVQKTEKHTKKMNTAKTKEKKEKEVKIDDLKGKLNEGTQSQKLEDVLPFLKPSKEEVEYATKFRKSTDEFTKLMSSGKIDEAIAMAKNLGKGPERKEDFTEKEREDFINARAKLAEQLGYKVLTNKEKFLTLEKDGYTIQMKHFMLPSGSGYNNGRISEIEISKGKIYSLWDNGWDKKPKDEGTKKIFDEIVSYFN